MKVIEFIPCSFFDLDSALNTVEFCVLLCELFNAGVAKEKMLETN